MSETNYLKQYCETPAHDLDAYVASGGFQGLANALAGTPAAVVNAVKNAKLAGRGGAGFDAGTKWSTVPPGETPYLVCNADEGEPGTFKDRYLLENAPLLVIEGMVIAGYAIGAREGFIYVRGEYPQIAEDLETLIDVLVQRGYLGSNISDSDFSFTISVMIGGGSYVVGDETALLSSLMGRRGYPLAKPPFPTESGLWERPTVVNNVETLACVPLVLARGAAWFSSIGTPACPGPKLFSVSGHVTEPGVYEFPMGTKLGEILQAAGGIRGNLKAVQIGGTAGPVYDASCLEFDLDFPSMRDRDGALGSGALVVMNSSVAMIHVLEVSMRFFSEESCGKCFACRYGTRQLEYMANRIAAGQGKPEYLALMRGTVESMHDAAFCPFGQSIRLPLLSLLDRFGGEIEATLSQQEYVKEVI